MRRVVLLTILLFVIHLAITTKFVFLWTETSKANAPIAAQLPASFALALCTLPLYPVVGTKLTFFGMAVANSLLVAFLAALGLVYLRWRVLVAIVVAIPVLFVIIDAVTAPSRVVAPQRATSDNGGARRIDEISKTLVVDARTRSSLNDYFRGEIDRADNAIDPLPQDLQFFLTAHRFELTALEEQLLAGEPPRWAANRDLLRYFTIQKLILADALQNRSWARVDAAHRLTHAFLGERDIGGVFLAIAAADNELGVARKLDPPPHWPLHRFDPYQAAFDALASEADEVARIEVPWYVRPYERLAAAETIDSAVEEARVIRAWRGCRFTTPPEESRRARVSFNPFGVLSGAGARLAVHANRLRLDEEGTERIMAGKRGDTKTVASAVCPDRKWTISDGEMRLQPDLVAPAPALPTDHSMRTQ